MHSFAAVSTALLACAGSVAATKFSVVETYDKTNFLDKFNFWNQHDPANGDVTYVGQAEALNLGLVGSDGDDFFVRPETTKKDSRRSVRLESRKSYTEGLMIARFTHFPKPACGLWPAFWTKGDVWPGQGEIDIYEHWNLEANNQPALHTGNASDYGACFVDNEHVTGQVLTSNCDNTFTDGQTQFTNQGCSANANSAPYGSSNGGIYALEWTGESISIYGFSTGAEPSNINSDHPDTASWGQPIMRVSNNKCNLNKHFGPQRVILNLDFCGEPAKFPWVWDPTCGAQTGVKTCTEFVNSHPEAFAESFFKVKDIRFFQDSRLDPVTTSSTVVSSTSTTVSSSSTSSSTTAVSSSASSTQASSSVEQSSASSAASSSVASETISSSGQSATASTKPTGVSSSSEGSVISSSTRWSNSSVSATSVEMTTSTVYTTRPVTITSCAPTVTSCPIGKVTTETVALYTTVCPVSKGTKPSPSASKPTGGSDNETITTHITTTYTITSCAPTVTNCPVGKVTTEVITTTYCPGKETPKQTGGNPKPSQSLNIVPGWNNSTNTLVATPSATGGYYPGSDNSCHGENCPGTGNKKPEGCTGENCPPSIIASSGARVAVSALAAVVGLVAFVL